MEQLITSFLASAAFGVIFQTPKSTIIKCGIVGMSGWIIYFFMTSDGYDAVPSALIASIVISLISHLFSKWYKTPVIIFNVAGIIPLVPGGLAYDAMRKFVENDYNLGLNLAAKTLLISGAIALGLIFSAVISQILRRIKGIKQ